MAKKQKITKNENPIVDVSDKESHAAVQCDNIRLISSSLSPILDKAEADKSDHVAFRVRGIVEENKAYSYLEVIARHKVTGHPGQVVGFNLAFVLMGTFSVQQEITPENLANFVKMYTVTILWPYAREFATNQFRRTGSDDVVLPIINPQVVTEHIVENNLVDVQIISKTKPKTKKKK